MAQNQQHLEKLEEQAKIFLSCIDGFEKLLFDFVEASGVSKSRVSVAVYGSPDLFRLLKRGRDFKISTIKRACKLVAGEDLTGD